MDNSLNSVQTIHRKTKLHRVLPEVECIVRAVKWCLVLQYEMTQYFDHSLFLEYLHTLFEVFIVIKFCHLFFNFSSNLFF